jgi:hypothetical protein
LNLRDKGAYGYEHGSLGGHSYTILQVEAMSEYEYE